jgi:hypothetical protein
MLFHVFLHECQDDIRALHHASAEYNYLRIVGVDHRNRVSRPYVQTMLLNCTRDSISVSGCSEERLKVELSDLGQARFVKSWCFSRNLWQ